MIASNPKPEGEAVSQGDRPQPVFAATITPHRSLTPAGFRLTMTLICLVMVAATVPFMALGAWPVLGFGGLDVLALYIAFKVNFRAGRGVEEVVVTPIELMLRRITPGTRKEWRFNPLWTRLERKETAEFGVEQLALVSRGQRVTVGAWLSPPERATFAEALSRALAQVRRG